MADPLAFYLCFVFTYRCEGFGSHTLGGGGGLLNPAVHCLSAMGYQPSGKQNMCLHLGCGRVEPSGFMRAADATEAADGQWSSQRSHFGVGRLFVLPAPGRGG